MDIYNAKLAEWPVPYESVFLETSYGKVHVIVSRPTDALPLLLIHASAVAGASIGGYIATNYALYAPERVKGSRQNACLGTRRRASCEGTLWTMVSADPERNSAQTDSPYKFYTGTALADAGAGVGLF